MNTSSRPSIALRPQRDSLRHKQIHAGRPRASGYFPAALGSEHGSASDSVFKRMPAIGELPAIPSHG